MQVEHERDQLRQELGEAKKELTQVTGNFWLGDAYFLPSV
jgi:hypothetical protein